MCPLLQALLAQDSNLAYAAAKAGVDVMTKALAKALAPQVRVLAVSPGVVDFFIRTRTRCRL